MNKSIEKCAKNWQKTIQEYNLIVLETSKLLKKLDVERDQETQKQYYDNLNHLNDYYTSIEKIQIDIIKEIALLETSPLKRQLIGLISQPPFFAGLDVKSIETINKPEKTNMDTIMCLHEVYIEHIKLVSSKIIELLEKNKF